MREDLRWVPPEPLIERLYLATELKRWTDHIRPFELTVLGKHAHTMAAFWLLGQLAQGEGRFIDWDYAIRGSLYGLLRKSVLTDMKSQVFDRISQNPDRLRKVNEIALEGLEPTLEALGAEWRAGYVEYFFSDGRETPEQENAHRLLRACSALATAWEFRLIKPANAALWDLEETTLNCQRDLLQYHDQVEFLPVALGTARQSVYIDLVGRLRFQLRWGDIHVSAPKYVLDHSMVVAYLSYVAAVELGRLGVGAFKQPQVGYVAFFSGLLHDLPEALTRDVVRSVKRDEIDRLLTELEEEWLQDELKDALGEQLYAELSRLSLDPFREDDTWPLGLGSNTAVPHPGRLLKACDSFSAYIEAYSAYSIGIRTDRLREVLEWGAKAAADYADSGVDFAQAVRLRNEKVGIEFAQQRLKQTRRSRRLE